MRTSDKMTEEFPVYIDHEEVSCNQCKRRLWQSTVRVLGHEHGNGQFMKWCIDCNIRIWYDIRRKKS